MKKVKEYFPSFKPYGILRFLSLLGPGNPSSLPNVWKGAKKPKRRRKEGEWKGGITATWELDKEFTPPPEMCMSDDEVSQYVIGCAVFVVLRAPDEQQCALLSNNELSPGLPCLVAMQT